MDKDITTLLQEVRTETGWGETRLASEIGTSQPTVHRILKGQDDCRGSTYKALVALHQKVCVKAARRINTKSKRNP